MSAARHFLIYIFYGCLTAYPSAKGWVVMVLTFIFAVLNICLGFALAMYFWAGPPEPLKAVEDPGANPAAPEAAQAAEPASPAPA